MKTRIILVLTAILVSSCTSTVPANPTKPINTNEPIAPSSTPEPSSVDTKTPLSTTSSSPIPQTPSPWPTVPFIITPNADQLARWQEYEKALAENFISHHAPEDVLCEWLLLGQSEQEIYVWVGCKSIPDINGNYSGISAPGVIYLGTDGSVQNVRRIVTWTDDIHNHFPPDLQELLFSGEIKPQVRQMIEHLSSRMENPEPPLIVLSAMSAPNPVLGTPLPTQLTIVPTLNPTQVIQQEEIKSVIQEYFEIHYQALSISPPANFQETGFGDLVSDGPEAKDFLVTEMGKLAVERKHYEINKLRYTEYTYSLDYKYIVVDESTNTAKVSMSDYFELIRERAAENNPENPRASTGELSHNIILSKEQGEWKIISDIYWDSMWYTLRHPWDASTDEILRNIEKKMDQLKAMPSPTP